MSDILQYADFLELTKAETIAFLKIIRKVDLRNCILLRNKQAKQQKQTTNNE